jgi:hypothetical protein
VVATILKGEAVYYDPKGVFGDAIGTMPPDGASRDAILVAGLGVNVALTIQLMFG